MTDSTRRSIAFHVRCCLRRGRTLQETLRQIHSNYGHRPEVTAHATAAHAAGL